MNIFQVYTALSELKKDTAKLTICSATLTTVLNKLTSNFENLGSDETSTEAIHEDFSNLTTLLSQLTDILESIEEHNRLFEVNNE